MSRWIVEVRETRTYKVEVEAKDYSAASFNGVHAPRPSESDAPFVRSAGPKQQLGEPWVRPMDSGGWYDLHPPSDVVAMGRAHGNAFTEADVAMLRRRLNALGFKVVDSWNGAGCGEVSFKCGGRHADQRPMTSEQVAKLCAPRSATKRKAHDHAR